MKRSSVKAILFLLCFLCEVESLAASLALFFFVLLVILCEPTSRSVSFFLFLVVCRRLAIIDITGILQLFDFVRARTPPPSTRDTHTYTHIITTLCLLRIVWEYSFKSVEFLSFFAALTKSLQVSIMGKC